MQTPSLSKEHTIDFPFEHIILNFIYVYMYVCELIDKSMN